jgi:hypothetical protein
MFTFGSVSGSFYRLPRLSSFYPPLRLELVLIALSFRAKVMHPYPSHPLIQAGERTSSG